MHLCDPHVAGWTSPCGHMPYRTVPLLADTSLAAGACTWRDGQKVIDGLRALPARTPLTRYSTERKRRSFGCTPIKPSRRINSPAALPDRAPDMAQHYIVADAKRPARPCVDHASRTKRSHGVARPARGHARRSAISAERSDFAGRRTARQRAMLAPTPPPMQERNRFRAPQHTPLRDRQYLTSPADTRLAHGADSACCERPGRI